MAALLRGALEHLVSQGGVEWRQVPSARDEAVQIIAPEQLLRQATLVAIDEAGERVSTRCTSLLRETETAEAVQAALADLAALIELLRWLRESS